MVLRPFAPVAFTTFFTTTTSADSSCALTREGSPGKVRQLSARAVRLYLTRLSATCRISHFLACSSPASCLAAGSCSYGRAFAPHFLHRSGHPRRLVLHYGSLSLFPNISFLLFSYRPCRAHEGRHPGRPQSRSIEHETSGNQQRPQVGFGHLPRGQGRPPHRKVARTLPGKTSNPGTNITPPTCPSETRRTACPSPAFHDTREHICQPVIVKKSL